MTSSGRSRTAFSPHSTPPSHSPARPHQRWPGAEQARVSTDTGDKPASNNGLLLAAQGILQMDVDQFAYTQNQRLKQLTQPRRTLAYCALVLVFCIITFTALFWFFTSGGDRRVVNPVVSVFEFPLIPENALKVFACCKYLISICIAYNFAKYVLERKRQLVTLMNSLEVEASLMTGESRQDATVPRPGDDAKTREARETIAIRRLLRRRVFTFDVFSEPIIPREPDPTEEEVQLIREALELDAVKRLNDPRMLREYIRRRESRLGRRKVNMNMTRNKDRRRSSSKRTLKLDPLLNAIKEEDSSSQLSDQTMSYIFSDEIGMESTTSINRCLSFCEWNPERYGKTEMDDSEWSEFINPDEFMLHRKYKKLSPQSGRECADRHKNMQATSGTGSTTCSPRTCENSEARAAFPSREAASRRRQRPATPRRRSWGASAGSERRGKAPASLPPIVWNSLSQTMTPTNPPPLDTPFVPRGPPSPSLAAAIAGAEGGAGADKAQVAAAGTAGRCSGHTHCNKRNERRDPYDSRPLLPTSEEEDVDGAGRTAVLSSGDSVSVSDGGRSDGCSCDGCLSVDSRATDEVEVDQLLQPRSGWDDSRSSLPGLSSSLTVLTDVVLSSDEARIRTKY